MPEGETMNYIITDDMLITWRGGCVRPDKSGIHKCDGCKFEGVGARRNCCEFDDNAMQQIFKSVKYEREIKCPKCGGATFWSNTDGKDTCFCMNDSCKWKQAITATVIKDD